MIIERNVPYHRKMPEVDRAELHRHILVFLSEKKFEGCGGLKMTDEIKVTIAAQACILLLHRKTDYYPGLSSILVYPEAFITHQEEYLPTGVVAEGVQPLIGQSQRRGPVVLSWDDVKHSSADASDGHNVVFHEFAHQIDSSSGAGDGSAVLRNRSSFIAWARVLEKGYQKLRQEIGDSRPTLLGSYGATDSAEFFAVATEFFFERPVELARLHPELYNELKNFYQQDPAELVHRD
jgi:Mlc titration factor MtfA (ptsG expression regulator)